MKWANKSLEELEEVYWEEIAPEFRDDGYDPTTEYPSYQWLVEHGYRGFRYPFSGQQNSHNMTLAGFFADHVGLSSPSGSTFEWQGDHQATHDALNQYLESLAQSGLAQTTIETYQYELSTLLRLYQEEHGHVDIVSIADEGPSSLRDHWEPILSDLDRELGSRESKQKYALRLKAFYDFFYDDNNPFAILLSEVEWTDHDVSDPGNLDVSQVAGIYHSTASLDEQLVVLLTAGCGLSTSDCATLRTDRVQFTDLDEGLDEVGFYIEGRANSLVPIEKNVEAIKRRLNEHSYVFESHEAGRTHVTTETVRRWFKAAARRAGVSLRGDTPTPRDARKFFGNVQDDSPILAVLQTAAAFYSGGEADE